MKTEKIVILGGGSAGWMSAATLIRAFPDKDISVIESPDVPSVGVGESTLGQIRRWTRYIGLDEKDFIPFTDATYKFSIKFTDFHKKDSGPFHYPFGLPYQENENDLIFPTWYTMRYFYPELEPRSFVDMNFPGSKLWENNKYYANEDGRLGNFDPKTAVAYHFDSIKFGMWLKERYCMPRGVKHIAKHMERAEVGENGIEYLLMSDGEKITADLYVDSTGFRSLLLDKALHEPFISYSDIIPNNTAWATQIPYKDKYKELEPFTNCTAIENGWCWNIPLWSRIGTGYIYSDKYVSDEDALEEFKKYLCSEKMTVPRTREEVDSYTYKQIKTRIGIHERTFVKNVVAIGLSAGFIEPLESNGLLSVHEFLLMLVRTLSRGGELTEFDRLWYNNEVMDMFDGFAKFVAMHYAMSQRNDTKYWQDVSNREYKEVRGGEYMTRNQTKSSTFLSAQKKFFDMWATPYNLIDGSLYIAAGMNYNPLSKFEFEDKKLFEPNLEQSVRNAYDKWREREKNWENVAKEAPHMVDYLRNNFYSE